MPSLGGQERKLVDVQNPVWAVGVIFFPALEWSPDGEWLAYAEKDPGGEPHRIVRLSLETLDKEVLTSPPVGSGGDTYPAISPDGRQLAFARWDTSAGRDIWVQPLLAPGAARRLTSGAYGFCQNLDWTPDGREILFTADTGPEFTSFRVSLEGGPTRRVAGLGGAALAPSIRGSRMLFEQWSLREYDIWRVPGRRSTERDRDPEKVIVSSKWDGFPSYSPDGRKIAFTSSRAGAHGNIWVSDGNGTNPFQLTDFEEGVGRARWSPDGRQLVFSSGAEGDPNLYVVDLEGGVPRRLTRDSSAEWEGTWSRDGRWIYFASDRSGRSEIWKMPADGGPAVQVTRKGGRAPEESWDGRDLYYSNLPSEVSSICSIPVDGGEEIEVIAEPVVNTMWGLTREGIYFVTGRQTVRRRREEYTVHFLDFESGQVTELRRDEGPFSRWMFAISPDEEWILYGQMPAWESELMLVENFR